MIRSALTDLVAAKVLGLSALAAATLGGVSIAASSGALPGPVQDVAHGAIHSIPPAHTGSTGRTTPAVANATPSPSGRPPATSRPSASPSPSLPGLCLAYTAGVSTAGGKALENPAFAVLITTAGGQDHVAAFCATLLGARPAAHRPGKPTRHRTGRGWHVTGPPAAHPTGPPAAHRTGRPAALPGRPPTAGP